LLDIGVKRENFFSHKSECIWLSLNLI
jgi:hypothetical protein